MGNPDQPDLAPLIAAQMQPFSLESSLNSLEISPRCARRNEPAGISSRTKNLMPPIGSLAEDRRQSKKY
jgi:hypothetical protein